jgi:hypothetical protein
MSTYCSSRWVAKLPQRVHRDAFVDARREGVRMHSAVELPLRSGVMSKKNYNPVILALSVIGEVP